MELKGHFDNVSILEYPVPKSSMARPIPISWSRLIWCLTSSSLSRIAVSVNSTSSVSDVSSLLVMACRIASVSLLLRKSFAEALKEMTRVSTTSWMILISMMSCWNITRVISLMNPDDSASGINSDGGIILPSGFCHRSRASAPHSLPVIMETFGW